MLTVRHKKFLAASVLGSALEGYDFLVYIFFSHYISQVFFRNTSTYVATLETFAVFAAGYLARPVGGILFSHFGDRYGRKITFLTAIIVMTLSILVIGLLPTQVSIGVLAPTLLVVMRIIQGLSFGGEIPCSITFISEHIPKSKRVFANSLVFLGVNCGLLLASLVGTIVHEFLTNEQILSYGWRLPFLFGAVLGIASYFFRRTMTETEEFMKLKEERRTEKLPIVALFKKGYFLNICYGISLVSLAAVTVFFYLYTPGYASRQTGIPESKILLINTISTLIFSIFIVIAGFLSDRLKPEKIYFMGAILLLFLSYPLYQLILSGSFIKLTVAFFIFSVLAGFLSGTYPGVLSTLFQTSVRYTGISFIYNVAYAVFGGLSPLLCTLFVHYSKNTSAPGFYISLVSLFPLCALVIFHYSLKIKVRSHEHGSQD